MKSKKDIDYRVIARILNDVASIEEQNEFQEWISKKTAHREYFERFKSSYGSLPFISEQQVSEAWNRTQNQIKWKIVIAYTRKVVAVILPLFIIAGILYLVNDIVLQPKVTEHIQPGSSKAILKQESGELTVLNNETKLEITNMEGKVIGFDSLNVLSYQHKEPQYSMVSTLYVPLGAEYTLILSDGSKVYLNSESEITYPTSFNNDTREVTLKGEGFFEVVHQASKPFIVNAGESVIKVYGTSFNVTNYSDDAVAHTTLVDGSVSVTVNNKEYFIKPGQQFELNRSTRQLKIKEVEIDLFTAWKDGAFRFENMRLEDLAIRLARWYKVEFLFESNQVKNKRFTGSVSKGTEFKYFMNLIEKSTNVKIEINGATVLVKE